MYFKMYFKIYETLIFNGREGRNCTLYIYTLVTFNISRLSPVLLLERSERDREKERKKERERERE